MTDERPTHGGAANMPPFPRSSSPEPARPGSPDQPANPAEDAGTSASAEASNQRAPTKPDLTDDDLASDAVASETATPGEDSTSADDEADAESSLHAADGDVEEATDTEEEFEDWEVDEDSPDGGSFRSAVTAELARRAELSVLKGMEHVAESFEETAHRINRLASLRGGPEALSIGPVHSTVGWLEGAADYLRSSDLEAVQSDLRERVRARPVQSLGIALCAGWVIGRILR